MDYDMYEIVTANVDFASILSQLWKDTFAQAYADVHSAVNIEAVKPHLHVPIFERVSGTGGRMFSA